MAKITTEIPIIGNEIITQIVDNSAGAIQGFTITNNGNGTVNIDEGAAYLRAINDQYAPLLKYTISAVTNLSLTDNANNFVLVDYNGGIPTLTVTTNSAIINTETNSLMAVISRVGTTLDILSLVSQNNDANAKLRIRFLNQEGIRRANGAIIGFTNRNLTLTAGTLFSGLIKINSPIFNTATTDTFTYVYNNGSIWTRLIGQTQVDNLQYNNSGVLTTMSNNRFRVDYIYLLPNNPSKLYVVYGNTTYTNITTARTAPTPSSLPTELQVLGLLVGRQIIEKNATSISEVSSAFSDVFSGVGVPEHNALAGLQGGAVGDYQHMTTAEKADILHKTGDEIKTGTLTVTKTQTSGGSSIITDITSKANGEQFNTQSGEGVLSISHPVVESQSGGTGTDFTPSQPFTAIKFSTTATASFLQGIKLRIKKTGALTNTSTVVVRLYTDNAGIPGTAFGGGGTLFAGDVLSTFTDIDLIVQNVLIPVNPSTQYWVVITRTESGGSFVFDSSTGTGTTFQGATIGSISTETGVQLSNIIYARNAYGGHFVGNYSHAVWGTSITGVGVRGDSNSHFGGFFKSNSDWGVRGESKYSGGVIGVSDNSAGIGAITNSTNQLIPALRAENSNGATYLAAYIAGRSSLVGRTTIGAGTDYNGVLEVVGGISRFSGKLIMNATGVDVSTQDKGFTFDVNGSILKRAFGINTPYASIANGEIAIGGRGGGAVPLIASRTNSTTATGFFNVAIQNADVARTGDADFVFRTGFETGSDAIQQLTASGAAFQISNANTSLVNVFRNGDVYIGSTPVAGFKLNVQGTGNFTGPLTAPTATTGTNTTQVATTAFVLANPGTLQTVTNAGSSTTNSITSFQTIEGQNINVNAGALTFSTNTLYGGSGVPVIVRASDRIVIKSSVTSNFGISYNTDGITTTNKSRTMQNVDGEETVSLSTSAVLDFPATGPGTSSELTVSLIGAVDGDVVVLGVPNVSSNTNSCYTARVSSANTITVKFNNYSVASINPTSGTFKIKVLK